MWCVGCWQEFMVSAPLSRGGSHTLGRVSIYKIDIHMHKIPYSRSWLFMWMSVDVYVCMWMPSLCGCLFYVCGCPPYGAWTYYWMSILFMWMPSLRCVNIHKIPYSRSWLFMWISVNVYCMYVDALPMWMSILCMWLPSLRCVNDHKIPYSRSWRCMWMSVHVYCMYVDALPKVCEHTFMEVCGCLFYSCGCPS